MNDYSHETADEAMHEIRKMPAWLVLPGILGILLIGILAGRIMRPTEVREGEPANEPSQDANWAPSTMPTGETISLTIDFGNGAEMRFVALPWRDGMTALGALQAAAEFRPGITIAHRGSGEKAFVTAIDGLSNSDAGNWLYQVNGEKAAKSAGVQTLASGDALLWRYTGSE